MSDQCDVHGMVAKTPVANKQRQNKMPNHLIVRLHGMFNSNEQYDIQILSRCRKRAIYFVHFALIQISEFGVSMRPKFSQ